MKILIKKLPLTLAILLYILIYLLRLQQGGWEPKIDLLKSQRQALDQRISQILPSPQAELLSGILLGQSKSLPSSLKLALRDTSTLHIIVASGQNLTILAGFFLSLAGLIKRRIALILSLGVCVLYTILAGFQLPILRAAIMFALASIAQLAGREKGGLYSLIVTAGIMLWINPAWIASLSFQLSFLATFGVIVISPIFKRLFSGLPLIREDLAVTLSAQLMITPVIAQNFHQVSLVSLIVNVLILWTIPAIMILGVLMLAFSFIGILVNAFLTFIIYIVYYFSSLSFAWEYVGEQNILVWIGYYMILAAVMLSLTNAQKASGK